MISKHDLRQLSISASQYAHWIDDTKKAAFHVSLVSVMAEFCIDKRILIVMSRHVFGAMQKGNNIWVNMEKQK